MSTEPSKSLARMRPLGEGEVRWFHYKDGLYFIRRDDGSVAIEWHLPPDSVVGPFDRIALPVIDGHSWASVVASMSLEGENAHTYTRARIAQGVGPAARQE